MILFNQEGSAAMEILMYLSQYVLLPMSYNDVETNQNYLLFIDENVYLISSKVLAW